MAFHSKARLAFTSGEGANVRQLAYTGGARRIPLNDSSEAASSPLKEDGALHAAALRVAFGELAKLAASVPGGPQLLSKALSPNYVQAPKAVTDGMPSALADALSAQLASLASGISAVEFDAASILATGYGGGGSGQQARRASFASTSGVHTPSPTAAGLSAAGGGNPTVFSFVVPHGSSGAPSGGPSGSPLSISAPPLDTTGQSPPLGSSHAGGSSHSSSTTPRAASGGSSAVSRVGLPQQACSPVSVSTFTILPEVAWVEMSVPPQATPTLSHSQQSQVLPQQRVACLVLAEGEGRLSDAATGALIYAGHWRAGLRHGTGRATIVQTAPAPVYSPSSSPQPRPSPSSSATYEGDWRLGVRHGRGVLTDGASLTEGAGPGHGGLLVGGLGSDSHLAGGGFGGIASGASDRYDGGWALDSKHGSGTETQAGGGVFRGSWSSGAPHGCGVWTWPTAASVGLGLGLSTLAAAAAGGGSAAVARSEYRQYAHGALVAVRPLLQASLPQAGIAPSPPLVGSLLSAPSAAAAAAAAAVPVVVEHGSSLNLLNAVPPSVIAAHGATGSVVGSQSVASFVRVLSSHALPVAGEGAGDAASPVAAAAHDADAAGLPLEAAPAAGAGGAGPGTTSAAQLTYVTSTSAPGGILAALQPGLGASAPLLSHTQLPALSHQSSLPHHGLAVPQVPQPLNAAVLRLLKHSSVNDVGGGRVRSTGEVLTLDTTDTVESALTLMTKNNVLSVPVFDTAKRVFVAVLHIMDICAFMLDLVAKKKASLSPTPVMPQHLQQHGHGGSYTATPAPWASAMPTSPSAGSGGAADHRQVSRSGSFDASPSGTPTPTGTPGATGSPASRPLAHPSSPPHHGAPGSPGLGALSLGGPHHGPHGHGVSGGLREALAHQRRFATSQVSEVLAMRDHLTSTAFKPLPAGAPLLFAAQALSERGVHAVPIVDPLSGRLVRMLTQADVIRYVAAHLDELGPLGTMSVVDLGLVDSSNAGAYATTSASESSHHLVVARFSDRAFDILQAMRAHGAPAAPVVNAYGAIVANISFSDVKAIARRANFAALQQPIAAFLSAVDKPVEAINPSIYVKATTQFQSMVLTLAATKIHQLYCIDDALRPVGCVRISDILGVLTKEEE